MSRARHERHPPQAEEDALLQLICGDKESTKPNKMMTTSATTATMADS